MSKILQLYKNYIALTQPIMVESTQSVYSKFLEFKNDSQLTLSDQMVSDLSLLAKGTLVEKWFVYHVHSIIDFSSPLLLDKIFDGMVGIINNSNILNRTYMHFVRVYGFDVVSNLLLDKFENSKSTVERYFISQIQHAIIIPDMITYNSPSLILDATAQYYWKKDKYLIKYDSKENKAYQKLLNVILLRKHKIYLNAAIGNLNNFLLLSVLRSNLPSEEICPDSLRLDLNKVLNITED